LRLAADKMFMETELGKLLQTVEQERSIIQKICTGFRELNRGLDLESVFSATFNAINNLITVDCVAISLVKNDMHYIAFIRGGVGERFWGMEYEIHEGLVGQVLKLNHSLPANASYSGAAPVFSGSHCLNGYNSLFIMPLRPEKGPPLGAITVAAKADDIFGKEQQDILGLVADQAAIKIDLAKSHELISKMATTDGLTSLANHRTFQHGFDIMLHRAKRRKSPLTMILCDIDFFKKFNDNYGHQFGDKVLKAVAGIMASAIRKEDMAARYGGEEFAIILENSDKKGALIMAERIREDIAALKFSFEGRQIGVTISLGIAAFPKDGQEKTQIIELADKALYTAKNKGRNQTALA
jgi:diguanylate cyclase (GGDEF)-like protein